MLNRVTKHILLAEVNGGKILIQYTFNKLVHFLAFAWQIIHLKIVDVYTFWGEGFEKVYVLYTHLNVDNYGLPLTIIFTLMFFSYYTVTDCDKSSTSDKRRNSLHLGHTTTHLPPHSQKMAFVSPLISWLPTLQPQCTPVEHWRESRTIRLAVHYYLIFLIERRNNWPINLRGWKDELFSSSKMSLN